MMANIVMLGFLSAVSELVQLDSLRQAMLSSVPSRTRENNAKAFDRGREYGEAIQKSRAKLDQTPETVMTPFSKMTVPKKAVLLVGSGYGALKVAEDMAQAGVPVIWVTRAQHFLGIAGGGGAGSSVARGFEFPVPPPLPPGNPSPFGNPADTGQGAVPGSDP